MSSDWDTILEASYCYSTWESLEDESFMPPLQKKWSGQKNALLEKGLLEVFGAKKKIIYVSYRSYRETEDAASAMSRIFSLLKEHKRNLSAKSDGFFIYDLHFSHNNPERRETQIKHLSTFIGKCHVIVADEYDVYKDRFWMLWECLHAAKTGRLVINDNVKPLLKRMGMTPCFHEVKKLLQGAYTQDTKNKEYLLGRIQELYFNDATHSLIPVSELTKDTWEEISAVPVSIDQLNTCRVLMVSHRWFTVGHPDPKNRKLHQIREYCEKSNNSFQYVFFDYKCIDQQKQLTHSLARVDELYAKSHCLCLCDEEYFERSWCLFEISINTFNANSQTLLKADENPGELHNPLEEYTDKPEVLSWLEESLLLQKMGFIHALDVSTFTASARHFSETGKTHVTRKDLVLPEDQLHLKAELRTLFLNSTITNRGDIRVILTLLDSLI